MTSSATVSKINIITADIFGFVNPTIDDAVRRKSSLPFDSRNYAVVL